MKKLWERIKARLTALNPTVSNSFNPPATDSTTLEPLVPTSQADIYEWYKLNNGQDSGQTFIDRWVMLPMDEILDRYRLMNDEIAPAWVAQGLNLEEGESIGTVEVMLWNAHWVPFAEKGMDYLCFDFDPDEGGQPGQVIQYRREPEPVQWIAERFRAFMACIADRLEGDRVKLTANFTLIENF